MKTLLVMAFLAIAVVVPSLAQNKTLGVGIATPNPNAALHVESPTNNQGFIMPRLSTAQRTGIPGLTGAEDGMMLYDKDLKKIFVWDGGSWQPAAGLSLPFTGLLATPSTLFNITNTGTGTAGIFQISNAANSVPALGAATNGVGPAIQVNVTNASSTTPALNINHAGTGNAILANRPIQATQFIGDGSLLTNLPALTLPFTGTSSTSATTFNIGNTNTGVVAMFTNSGSSTNSAVIISNSGTGDGLHLNTANVSNTFPALDITHSGSGSAIRANRLIETAVTTNTGQAGVFAITNASNNNQALIASTTGTGNAGYFQITNTSSNVSALHSETDGTGSAMSLNVSNVSSTTPALTINHAGSGANAITANRPIQATQFIGDGSSLTGIVVPDINITAANQSISIGKSTTPSNEGVIIGDGAGGGTGTGNTFLGRGTGSSTTIGSTNVFLGRLTGSTNTAGNSNVFIGAGAGAGVSSGVPQTLGDNNILIGTHADVGTDALDNAIAIGYGAIVNASNSMVLGSSSTKVGIGIGSPTTKFHVHTTDLSSGGYFDINNGSNAGTAVSGITNGDGKAGYFEINKVSNGMPVLTAITNGTGSAISANGPIQVNANRTTTLLDVQNAGSGKVADFRLNDATSNTNALEVRNEGLGYTAYFRNGNASATGNAILAENYGLSATLRAFSYGSGDASLFNATGTGGHAGSFSVSNASNSANALEVSTSGAGSAILATSNSTGTTIQANRTAGTGNGIDVDLSGSATGKGGSFTISNVSNSSAAVDVSSVGTGPAIKALHSNNGIAIDISTGTLKYSVITTGTATITQRAGVYNLTAAGTYTLPSASAVDGETCLVYNSSGTSITVEGTVTINPGIVRQFIRIASAWRVVN